MAIQRATFIAKMRGAFRAGKTGTAFYRELRAVGPVYRKTDFLADFRDISKIEKVEGLARFVRKGYVPTERTAELEVFAVTKDYMYKIKTWARLRPDEKPTERFVNILSDKPMTVGMIEAEVEERWGEWEKYAAEELVSLQVWSAFTKAK